MRLIRVIGNIPWPLIAGLPMAPHGLVAGVVSRITIIGIPLGIVPFGLMRVPLALLRRRILPIDQTPSWDGSRR